MPIYHSLCCHLVDHLSLDTRVSRFVTLSTTVLPTAVHQTLATVLAAHAADSELTWHNILSTAERPSCWLRMCPPGT